MPGEQGYDCFERFLFLEAGSQKGEQKMKSKICPYCYTIFLEIDFPNNFEKRVTCGSEECMIRRIRDLEGNTERIREFEVANGKRRL